MRAYVRDNRIRTEVPYEMKDAMKAVPGFRWHAEVKEWSFPATVPAAEAIGAVIPAEGWSQEFGALHARAERLEGVQAIKSASELPGVPGRTDAWIEQRRAYHFVMNLWGLSDLSEL